MSRVVLYLLLLISSAFANQDQIQGEGASFGIVFDTTYSMNDELRQVKEHALSILTKALGRAGQPFQDFVLAPFNDPDVPAARITKNPAEFKGYLEAISVSGGGDNPEMVYSGLLNALNLVRPRGNTSHSGENENHNGHVKVSSKRKRSRSTIFVFTDDQAKDKNLLPEVLKLIQRKKVLVFFIVSSDSVEPTFEDVVAISYGQIFQLEKFEVSKVMEFIDDTLQADVVNILSVAKKGASEDKYPVAVDKTMDEFTASISGNNAQIIVSNPKGEIVTDKSKVVPLVDLDNAKVVKVNKPEPGIWNVTSSSTSDHAFRLTGVSKVDFISGFSAHKAVSLEDTFQLPLKGVKNYLTLSASDIHAVETVHQVAIIALDGTVLLNLTVNPIRGRNGLYRAESFLPPENAFYVTIEAEGLDGQIIKRTSQTGVVPAPPAAEMLSIKDEENSCMNVHKQDIKGIVVFFSALLFWKSIFIQLRV